MSLYLQRQLTSMIVPGGGATMTPSTQPFPAMLQNFMDTYPGNILAIGDGNQTSGEAQIAASGSLGPYLPDNYVNTQYLAVMVTSDQPLQLAHSSPDHADSFSLMEVGALGAGSSGFACWMDTINAVVFTNLGVVTANVKWFFWTYPADISKMSAWRSGAQSTGVQTNT